MLRSNLSTRPFYNERTVHLLMALAALTVLGFTFFNMSRVVSLSGENTELAARAQEAESQARQLRAAAQQTRQSLDPKAVEAVSLSAREANAIIDRRLFSWTELFNYFETTLPEDVRITSVRPKTERGSVTVSITVVGRRVEAVDRFMDALEATRAFADVLSLDERTAEDGNLVAVLEARYVPAQREAGQSGPGEAPQRGAPPAQEAPARGTGASGNDAPRGGGGAASEEPRGGRGPTNQR